jgi:hypothetical protein
MPCHRVFGGPEHDRRNKCSCNKELQTSRKCLQLKRFNFSRFIYKFDCHCTAVNK